MIYTVTLNPAMDETLQVQHLQIGATHRILSRRRDPGGKGINVARMLRFFYRDCLAYAVLGGTTGEEIAEKLQAEGLPFEAILSPLPTRTNLKLVSAQNGETTELNAPGAVGGMGCAEELLRSLLPRLKCGDTVVLCGSLPTDISDGFYRECIRACRKLGARVLLDTSGAALASALSAAPEYLKPNRAELEHIIGQTLPDHRAIAEAARYLLKYGVRQITVSLGAEGAILVTEDTALFAAAPAVAAVGTSGAGDAMVAAMLYAKETGLTLAEELQLAVATASAKTVRPGCELPVMSDIQALLPRIAVQKL